MHFGKQITASFLERNNLEFVIRSHEMVMITLLSSLPRSSLFTPIAFSTVANKVDEGFEWRHDNKLVTLFSASCYSGKNMNKVC